MRRIAAALDIRKQSSTGAKSSSALASFRKCNNRILHQWSRWIFSQNRFAMMNYHPLRERTCNRCGTVEYKELI